MMVSKLTQRNWTLIFLLSVLIIIGLEQSRLCALGVEEIPLKLGATEASYSLKGNGSCFIVTNPQFTVDTGKVAQLKITIAADNDIRLFGRYGKPVELVNGRPAADFESTNGDSPQTYTLDATTNPALKRGKYYLAVATCAPKDAEVKFVLIIGGIKEMTSGVPETGAAFLAEKGFCYLHFLQYKIVAGANDKKMKIQLSTKGNVKAYVRYQQQVEIKNGKSVKDLEVKPGEVVIDTRQGDYYFAINNCEEEMVDYKLMVALIKEEEPDLSLLVPKLLKPNESAPVIATVTDKSSGKSVVDAKMTASVSMGNIDNFNYNKESGKYETTYTASNTSGIVKITVTASKGSASVTGTATIEIVPQCAGDLNGDGKVDIFDLVIVGQNLDEKHAKDPRADVNGDGKVDIFDLVIVGQNFGNACQPAAPMSVVEKSASQAQVWLEFAFHPKGGFLTVDLKVNAKDTNLYGYQCDLVFDAAALEAISVTEGELLRNGTSTYWRPPMIANRNGQIIGTSATRIVSNQGVNTDGILASFVFRIKDAHKVQSSALRIENLMLVDAQAHLIHPSIMKTCVLKPGKLALPPKTALSQNYPNPFNPETWIPYQLAETSDVTIRIYNTSGRLVRMLELGRRTAGFYLSKDKAVYWDGKNTAGEYVGSGIYFYTIQAGPFTATKKMIIAK